MAGHWRGCVAGVALRHFCRPLGPGPSVVRFLADKGARIKLLERSQQARLGPLKIAEGVQRGMKIVSSPSTAEAIRQVMAAGKSSIAL